MEELNWRRVLVVSVGMCPRNATVAVARAGVGEGDVVVLVNSEPRVIEGLRPRGCRMQPQEAVEHVKKFIGELSLGVETRDVWLTPREPFVDNVARLRTLVESLAPCKVTIAMAGGLRWLSNALVFLAIALKTVGGFNNIIVDEVFVMLEEESLSIRKMFPTLEERIIKWPIVPTFTELTQLEYRVLRLVANGVDKAKYIEEELNRNCLRNCPSRATVERVLAKLVKKKLATYDKAGRAHRYRPTDLGKILALNNPYSNNNSSRTG